MQLPAILHVTLHICLHVCLHVALHVGLHARLHVGVRGSSWRWWHANAMAVHRHLRLAHPILAMHAGVAVVALHHVGWRPQTLGWASIVHQASQLTLQHSSSMRPRRYTDEHSGHGSLLECPAEVRYIFSLTVRRCDVSLWCRLGGCLDRRLTLSADCYV